MAIGSSNWVIAPTFTNLSSEEDRWLKRLKKALKKHGLSHEVYTGKQLDLDALYWLYPPDSCVVFHGPLFWANTIARASSWYPGAWLSANNYTYTTYASYSYGPFLINNPYRVLSVEELWRLLDYSPQQSFITKNQGFFRPNSGMKPFPGGVYSAQEVLNDRFGHNIDKEELVVCALPKRILREWRCFVTECGRFLSGCQYKRDGAVCFYPGVPDEVKEFVSSFISIDNWSADAIYSIDVGLYQDWPCDRLGIVEVNSFCGAGLYLADLDPIIETANLFAMGDYHEMFGY